ncbi:TonB-dependent receptor domain-containing protein, partial [Clostridium perfringens]
VLGGVRKSWYENTFEFYGTPPAAPNRANATSPNFGVIFDATSDFSIFANYIKGVSPVTSLAFDKSQLPNITTTNKEA